MPDEVLEVASNPAQEPSAPAADAKPKAEEGEINKAPDEASTEGEGKAEKPKPELTEVEKVKLAMQKRVDRLTAASKAEAERSRRLEQELAQLKASSTAKADDAPKQDDFDKYEDWEKASIEYHAKKRADELLKAEKEKELQAVRQRQAQEAKRRFDEQCQAFRTQHTDFDAVSREAVEILNTLAQTGVEIGKLESIIMQFENPPQLIYELGKDTSLIEDLVSMEPLKAMKELVKLELALQGTAQAEPKQAPEPIKPTSGKGGAKPLHMRSGKDVLAWVKS